MDRAIFDLKASVEATSLYILLSALSDRGQPLSLKVARPLWNGAEEDLAKGAKELIQRGVLKATLPLTEETTLYINAKSDWQ